MLVAAGLIFGTASVVEWMMAAGIVAAGGIAHLYLWGTAGVLFAIALFVLIARHRGRAGMGSPANRAFGNAWMACNGACCCACRTA